MSPTDGKDKNNAEVSDLDKAQLQKLELEIAALRRQAKEQESTETAKQEKLKLEVKTLIWQTGRIYRLSQFAIIFSITATLVTVFATTFGIWTSYNKDIENKQKELKERTDGLYRTQIQRLIQYPIEPKMTIADAVFLFRDLEEVVNGRYERGDKQDRQRKEMGLLLTELIKSPDFDLSIARNIEFDREAMSHSEFYKDYLIHDPVSNMTMISKYQTALREIHESNPKYMIVPDATNETLFFEYNPPADPAKKQVLFQRYSYIFFAYRTHVQLMSETAVKRPELRQVAENYVGISFCLFFRTTGNTRLTQKIYGGDDDMVRWRGEQCDYSGMIGEGYEME